MVTECTLNNQLDSIVSKTYLSDRIVIPRVILFLFSKTVQIQDKLYVSSF